MKQLIEILHEKLAKRGIEGGAIELPDELEHSGKIYSVDAKLKQRIETGLAKKIVKRIKDSKLMVQAHEALGNPSNSPTFAINAPPTPIVVLFLRRKRPLAAAVSRRGVKPSPPFPAPRGCFVWYPP